MFVLLSSGHPFLDWFLNPTDENTSQVWGWLSDLSSYFTNFIASIPSFYVPLFLTFIGIAVTYMIIGRQA